MAETITMQPERACPPFVGFLSDDDDLGDDIKVNVENKNPPRWVYETSNMATSFLTLRKSWDTYGADVIGEDVVTKTLESLVALCEQATPLPSLVPLSNGGIQIEWHTRGKNLELEVGSEGITNLFYYDEAEEKELSLPDAKITKEYITRIS